MNKTTLALDIPNLQGLIHIWGKAGSGKTILATALAANASVNGTVEWICTDGKKSFLPFLKKNILHQNGALDNVIIQFPQSYKECYNTLVSLPEETSNSTRYIVIDSLTRVLDMSRESEELWGRELIEDVLPTLAGLSLARNITIVFTSEIREIPEKGATPVHHSAINRWSDYEIVLAKSMQPGVSEIFLQSSDLFEISPIGSIFLNIDGIISLHNPEIEIDNKGGLDDVWQGIV